MIRHLIIFVLALSFMSCASNRDGSGTYIYAISKGDKFILKQDIIISARKAHVILQDGKIEKFANIDKYAPFCRFKVNTKGAQTIKPGTFTATKVIQSQPKVLPGAFNYSVQFDLSAPNNPNIRNLACGAWGSSTDGYLAFPQMQEAPAAILKSPHRGTTSI